MNDKKTNIDVFIAYARKDVHFLDQLRIYLKPLHRNKTIEIWYDGEIVPGTVWEKQIKTNLHNADIILMLVSAYSLASDYFYDKELAEAMERHHREETIVIPVILSDCTWELTDLKYLQALPRDGKPLDSWDNESSAYANIVRGLYKSLEEVQKRRDNSAKAIKLLEARKQEDERITKEQTELKRKQDEERIAKEQAEFKRKQEDERITKEQTELKRKQDEERIAKEQAEFKRKQEDERITKEQTELKRKQDEERITKEQTEFNRKEEEHLHNFWISISNDWKKIFEKTIHLSNPPKSEEIFELLNLNKIVCSNTDVKSLEPIKYFTKLEYLSCSFTQISDIKPIYDINLKYLNCKECPIDRNQLKEYKSKYPKCVIDW